MPQELQGCESSFELLEGFLAFLPELEWDYGLGKPDQWLHYDPIVVDESPVEVAKAKE